MPPRHHILVAGLCLAVFITGRAVLAQGESPGCPPLAEASGCVQITLSPSELAGDFYLSDQLVVSHQNPAFITVPAGISQRIEIRNIQSTQQGFGTLFVYDDAVVTTTVAAGKTRAVMAFPSKRFIRGTTEVICDVRGHAGENVNCQVSLDSVLVADLLAPGTKGSYVLDPGTHSVGVVLVGDQASLWDPPSRERTMSITAGGTRQVSVRFDKKALVMLVLDQSGVVADFYMDGQLLASQVASYQLYVAPYKTHKFEARNNTDPAAADVYRWKDSTTSTSLASGSAKTVTLRLQRQYLKGFLSLKCSIANAPQGEALACQPMIDGITVETIPAGSSHTYTVDPGNHRVEVTLTPQGNWSADPVVVVADIIAGRTTYRTARFRVKPFATPTPTTSGPAGVITAHGIIDKDTVWSGTVHVIGDLLVRARLTIRPGTTVLIAANSDVKNYITYEGDTLEGVNPGPNEANGVLPGERFRDENHHVSIEIQGPKGVLYAVGTPTRPIIITSDSPNPQIGDWNRLSIHQGVLSYAHVSYYRMLIGGDRVLISNNVLMYSYEFTVGSLSGMSAGPTIENNDSAYAGHELINLEGPAIVRDNRIGPNPRDFSVGYGGIGIAIHGQSLPTITGNIIQNCDHGVRLVDGEIPGLDTNLILSSNTFIGNNQDLVNQLTMSR